MTTGPDALPATGGTRTLSLSARVGIAMAVILAVGGLLVMLAALTYGQQAARETYDQLLVGAANDIAASITVRNGEVVVDTPLSAFELLGLAPDDRIAYRVISPEGTTYTGYETVALPENDSAAVQFYDADFFGEPARFVAVSKRFAERRFSGNVMIVVGHTKRARDALALNIVQSALLVMLVAGLAMVVLAVVVVRSALRPLQQVGDLLRDRDPKDLTPLDLRGPRETVVMLSALNGFMQRVERQLGIMRSLIGDAAHQLRTPVSALRAQAELAADEPDPERRLAIVSRIHRRSVGLGRLLDQLLSHALITHRADAFPLEDLDLRTIAIDVMDQSDYDILNSGETVVLDLAEDPVMVTGDRLSLVEACKNLLNNAVVHGVPPIRLRVSADRDGAVLAVEDHGGGPPEEIRQKIGERFASGLVGRSNGIGLGLSIIASVATAHAGSFAFGRSDGNGCAAIIKLPLAKYRRASVGPTAKALVVCFLTGSVALQLANTGPAAAQEAVVTYGAEAASRTLLIRSTTDIAVFEPVIRVYRAQQSDLGIRYEQWGSNALYQDEGTNCAEARAGSDIVISSAVQQMVRLVNDACAQPHSSAATDQLSPALNWRNELFGVTREPAVIVYNRDLVPAEDVPRSRFELIDLLRPIDSKYAGRVATYDIEESGLGYLFAFMDALEAATFGALLESFARTGGVATCCSAEIISGVADGRFLIAYNVLGSYAMLRAKADPRIGVIAPEDYTLVLSRAAMIPKTARSSEEAKAFLDFLLSPDGRLAMDASNLNVQFGEDGEGSLELPAGGETALRPIELNPALLVALDKGKRSLFISRWRETFSGQMIP